VAQCCQLKADVVAQDEFDKKGVRNVLNFGHTIGHALEMAAEYSLKHGEAISIGMVAASELGAALGTCDRAFCDRLAALLTRAGLPTHYPDAPGLFERIVRAMQMDKKFRDGKNLFVLPTRIGAWRQQENIPAELVEKAIRAVLR
jgi:3-dehydroquinate synthase